MSRNVPLLFLFGPTGVGKTALLEELFSRGFEIVNTDALQIYRGMDIGTAKPSKAERSRIPHHLLDIRTPDEPFSAGDFVDEALKTIPAILDRGNIPIFSGGTAFYFTNFLYGLPDAPKADPEIRSHLMQELNRDGLPALYTELEKIDPKRAEELHPNDKTRILRSLEIYRQTGQRQSQFHQQRRIREGFTFCRIGLNRERKELYERIEDRVDEMVSQGLQDEVKALQESGYGVEDPGMKGIGYREFFLYPEKCLEELAEEIKKNSRRYAKRQLTFFSSIPEVSWFHPDEKSSIKKKIENFLSA